MASILEAVNMIADFGQQQWSYTNFRLSDRTLRSRYRILEFSQELVKICTAANNIDIRVYILACWAGTSSWYSTGGTPPIKAGRLKLCFHLGSTWQRGNISTSSSASPGGSQQLEIPLSPNSKRAANIFQISWYFSRRRDFNVPQDSIGRLYFYQTPTFCKSANILCIRQYFGRRQHFGNPQIFS